MKHNDWTDPSLQLDLRNPGLTTLAAEMTNDLREHHAPTEKAKGYITAEAVEMILANILERPDQPLRYSRTRDNYKKTASRPFLVENVRDTLDAMSRARLVILVEGTPPSDGKPGLQPTLTATEELLDRLDDRLRAANVLREVILLRDVFDHDDPRPWKKPEVQYDDTDETRAMRAALLAYNAMMAEHEVRDEQNRRHTTHMVRIFSRRTFAKGGRFYRASYQGLGKEDRARLTIDGAPVVERDFSAFHPNLIYNCPGFEAPEEPYEVAGFEKAVMKPAWNIAINAEDREQAAHALATEHLAGDLVLARQYIDAAVAAHPMIEDKFFTGFGLILQRLDSDMAAELLREFVAERKPVLVMHDSFLVKSEDEPMLLASMNRVYRMATKGRFDAKIK